MRHAPLREPDHPLEAVTPRENARRGVGIPALNTKKTHCLRGHEFTDENTRQDPRRRVCRACSKMHATNYSHRGSGARAEVVVLRARVVSLRDALVRSHACATLRDDGTCTGCFVSEALREEQETA